MMVNKHIKIFFLSLISLLFSCGPTQINKDFKDSYIVLDKEGMTFTIFSSLKYFERPDSIQLQENLDIAKRITRLELGRYHIIESCLTNKDWIFSEVENKVVRTLNHESKFSEFIIDSIYIDDYIKKLIITKFGTEYEIK